MKTLTSGLSRVGVVRPSDWSPRYLFAEGVVGDNKLYGSGSLSMASLHSKPFFFTVDLSLLLIRSSV